MGQRDDKEKEKTRRVETAKLFYNLCHSTVAITILGNAAPLLGFSDTYSEGTLWLLIVGLIAASFFFLIGYNFLKK